VYIEIYKIKMLFDKILVEYIFRNFNENSEKQALLKNIRSTVYITVEVQQSLHIYEELKIQNKR
jgi:hypothetical protein